jgi:hypothetical protein
MMRLRGGLLGERFWFGDPSGAAGIPRPEIDCCRACGFDLRQRREDYLLCPECGSPNNREMARRITDPGRQTDGPLAWRYWVLAIILGCTAFYPGVYAASQVAHWLRLPASPPARIGAAVVFLVFPTVFLVAWVRTPPAFRERRRWLYGLVAAFLSFGIALLGVTAMACGLTVW